MIFPCFGTSWTDRKVTEVSMLPMKLWKDYKQQQCGRTPILWNTLQNNLLYAKYLEIIQFGD